MVAKALGIKRDRLSYLLRLGKVVRGSVQKSRWYFWTASALAEAQRMHAALAA